MLNWLHTTQSEQMPKVNTSLTMARRKDAQQIEMQALTEGSLSTQITGHQQLLKPHKNKDVFTALYKC